MVTQPRTAELLWGSPDRPKRGPKPALSLERIVATAISMADAEGLATLSMQRLAEDLGFTKMSLYRYTPGKAELTALMLDAALGPAPDLSEIDGGWRAALHEWALRMWAGLRRHPWVVDVAVGPRVMGPNELGWLETGLSALSGTGLTGGERLDSVVLITGHVRSLAQQSTAPGAETDTPEKALNALMTGILTDNSERYPEAAAAFASARSSSGQDDALEFGLARIFDGLAALVAERAE
ncbi:TetR family transcriptional regulator [Rhodococcus sp. ACS1]|jgi:AcrR family transcriptional regulator|uniref:TetR/AcrR family transcriptional regulator n=2 Tax=Nocardiaceae TaxID=85025 RepID=UPI000BB122D7|nr:MULTISPECIES: TetR/AcrR family transcriptional regulator [Rhodococcus]PBC47765.1 TetR family transcriptional regulator [Rhodococcus sp. ACS1]QSE80638.1 TetR/AcrR family transcriptional regulator [Rhodococcus koreensis]